MFLFEGQYRPQSKDGQRGIKIWGSQEPKAPACRSQSSSSNGQHRRGNEAYCRRLQAAHQTLDGLAAFEFFIELGNDQNHDKGGQYRAQGGTEGAKDTAPHTECSAHLGAHIGRHIDGKGAGGAFADRDEIDQKVLGHPAMGYNLLLNQRQHGVSAAEGKGADLKEGEKQIQKNHCFSLLSAMIELMRPNTAQPMITKITLISVKAANTKEAANRI